MKIKNLNETDSPFIVLLSLVAFTIPMSMLLNNIIFIALILFWLIMCVKKKLKKPRMKLLLMLTIPYLLLIIGSFYSTNLLQVNTELTKGIPFLLLPIILLTIPIKISNNRLNLILKSFVLGNLLICIYLVFVLIKTLLLEPFTPQSLWDLTHQSLSSHVNLNAIYLAMYISISLTILLSLALNRCRLWSTSKKILYGFIAALMFTVLIFLSSRTVILSCIFVNSVLFLHNQLKSQNSFIALGRLILIISLISIGVFTINPILKWRIESIFDLQDDSISSNREQGIKMRDKLWTSSIEVIKENWLIGVGTGDYKDELEKIYRENDFRIQFRHHMNSHNQYLSYGVSNGLIGLLLFILYLVFCLYLFLKSKDKLPLFLALTFLLCFMTESHLYTNKGVIVVAFFLTLLSKYAIDNADKSLNEKA